MSSIKELNHSLLYLFIFTIISSGLAFYLVVNAYNNVFDEVSSINVEK
ncbi:MAG: hypothetical protein WA060_01055 [Minisyncoccia bacterium]